MAHILPTIKQLKRWEFILYNTQKKAKYKVNEKSCRLRMGAYRDGVKRKRDKIGMGL